MTTTCTRSLSLCVGLLLTGCGRLSLDPAAGVERPAPPIKGVNGQGQMMQLSEYQGKVVLLDFWKTG